MKVLLTKKFQSSDVDYIKSRLHDGIELIEPKEFTEDSVVASIPGVDVLLGGMLTEKVVEASTHIKLFQIPWTGVDTVNFELLRKHNVDCVCNSHSNASVVAEHAMALYGAVAKKLAYHDSQMREGNWNRISPKGNEVDPFSRSMSNQNVVFVGYGAVNRAVHKILKGFDPKVSVVNRSGQVIDPVDGDVEVVSCEKITSVLVKADVIFVAIPLTEETTGLINENCFSAMSQDTILINVARGSVICEKSLYSSLNEKRIFGAGIDTWYNYPKPGEAQTFPSTDYAFQQLHNLVMSPHRAGYINSGFPHLDDAILNLNNLKSGKPLVNVVSAEARY